MTPNQRFRRIALIGGSCSGKTTLIGELGRRGFSTVCEAALIVIEELTPRMGVDTLSEWRQSNFGALQLMIAHKQLELERTCNPLNGNLVFCDGGLLDPVAYCRYFDIPLENELSEAVACHAYDTVFALESLSSFVPRFKAGRLSDRRTSYEIGLVLRDVYRQCGYRLVEVPIMAVEERADHVLESLSTGAL